MGQDPSDIRAEIEATRARVGDEVDALSYKTDVPARMGDYVDDKKQAVKDKVSGVKDAIVGTTSDAVQTTSDALPSGQQLGKLKDTAERNPLGLVIGGAAIGFVAGLLLPSTRLEDRQMGEMSDKVIDAAKETASDALESGKQIAADAADTAKEQGQELASSLQDRAQESLASSPGRLIARMVVSGPCGPDTTQAIRRSTIEEAEMERQQQSTTRDAEQADEPLDNNRPGDHELPGKRDDRRDTLELLARLADGALQDGWRTRISARPRGECPGGLAGSRPKRHPVRMAGTDR